MSIIERLKSRQLISPVVEVNLPAESPEFVFQVARMPQAEIDCAILQALEMLSPLGSIDDASRNAAYIYSFTSYLKRHIKSWKHNPKEGEQAIAYSRSNLDQLFAVLTLVELGQIVAGYGEATTADEKKTPESVSSVES